MMARQEQSRSMNAKTNEITPSQGSVSIRNSGRGAEKRAQDARASDGAPIGASVTAIVAGCGGYCRRKQQARGDDSDLHGCSPGMVISMSRGWAPRAARSALSISTMRRISRQASWQARMPRSAAETNARRIGEPGRKDRDAPRGTVGGSLAHADPAAELPGVAVTCEGEITLFGPAGSRTVRAGDFFTGSLSTLRQLV
jgi:FAD binding domain in molybdopterin dehydrogenase